MPQTIVFVLLSISALHVIAESYGLSPDKWTVPMFTWSDSNSIWLPYGYAVWREEIRALLHAGYHAGSKEPFSSASLASVAALIAAVRDGATGYREDGLTTVSAAVLEHIAAMYVETPTMLPPKARKTSGMKRSGTSGGSRNIRSQGLHLMRESVWDGTAFVSKS
jgi:hypothetical protein